MAGVPVLCSNFPLWKEVVEENECGYCVNPFEPKAMALAIEKLVRNEEEAKKMGQNGQSAVEKIYNGSTEAKKLLKIYKEI